MAEETVIEESLQTILCDIRDSIKNSGQVTGNKQLKRKIVENFHGYIGQNFFVDKNEELDSFLKDGNKGISEELCGFSRTYFLERLFINEVGEEELEYLGFVTIRITNLNITDVEKAEKKKLLLSGKSPNNVDSIPCFLIEQVAKNANIEDNPICAKHLLDLAVGKINEINNFIGSALVILMGINVEKVLKIYTDYGFQKFDSLKQPEGSSVSYQPMYMKLPTGVDSLR